ncbi:MAG: SMC family ATPase [Christensenellaceae bacterium]|nr:SMC family ATPase [Christensenellaceae bacterium]
MRPIKLTMSAFGCFADKEIIDFSLLGNNGLYLITGDTGSGKTTIFDAIVYALYGNTSGDSRKADMLRSEYAEPTAETYVELEFIYYNETYKIMRHPTYTRAKRRGDGKTEEKAYAELTLPDGLVLTKISDVNSKINEILGIDREQFVQISMIAQGEFLKVLHSSTEARIGIFRKIFYTDVFLKFQTRVKNDTSDILKKLNEEKIRYKFNISNIQADQNKPEDIELLIKIKSEVLTIDDTIEWLINQVARDKNSYDLAKIDISNLKNRISAVSQQLGVAQNQKNARDNLRVAIEQLPIKESAFNNALSLLDTEMSKKQHIEQLKTEINDLEATMTKYEDLQNVLNGINSNQKKLDKKKSDKVNFQKKLDDSIDNLNDARVELKVLDDVEVKLEISKNKEKELTTKQNELNKLQESYRAYEKMGENYKKSLSEYELKYKVRSDKLNEYELANKSYFDAQVGILAETLVDGSPCPVCGSVSHPNKALLKTDTIKSEALNKIKKQFDNAESEMMTASLNASKLNGQLVSKKDEVISCAVNLLGEVDFEDIIIHLEDKYKEVEAELLILNKQNAKQKIKADKKRELSERIPDLEDEIKIYQESYNKLDSDITILSVQITTLNEKKVEMEKYLKYESEDEATSKLNDLKKQLSNHKTSLESAINNFNNAKTEYTNIKTTIEVLSAQVDSSDSSDYEELITLKNTLEAQCSQDENEYRILISRLDSNQQVLCVLKELSITINNLQTQYKWMKELSDVANGDVIGREKIKLETFVQTSCFDRIIECANIRLLEMTNSQFELIRKNNNGKQGQSGLDLNVIDHYNGTERDVKTLSGGESFIATLALAIGLSDEIQKNSGGIKLDSMFVDEGFGTLDETRLSQALNCLTSLSLQNRIIGIISHVGGLPDMIDKQIKVVKDRFSGSHASICLN